MKLSTNENLKLKKKVDTLETENKTLMQQLAQLQTLVARTNPVLGRPFHLGTGLMVSLPVWAWVCDVYSP